MLRADSAYYRRDVIEMALRHDAGSQWPPRALFDSGTRPDAVAGTLRLLTYSVRSMVPLALTRSFVS